MRLFLLGVSIFMGIFGKAQSTVEVYKPISKKFDKQLFSFIFPFIKDTTAEVSRYNLLDYSMKYPEILKQGDLNGDGKLIGSEVLLLIKSRKLFQYRDERERAAIFLFELDKNQDGYLEELHLETAVIDIIENNIDHTKYSFANDGILDDADGNMRITGNADKDGKISISEMINAMSEYKVSIGAELNMSSYLFK